MPFSHSHNTIILLSHAGRKRPQGCMFTISVERPLPFVYAFRLPLLYAPPCAKLKFHKFSTQLIFNIASVNRGGGARKTSLKGKDKAELDMRRSSEKKR